MSLAIDLTKFCTQTGKSMLSVRRAVVLSLFGSVIRDTPVDTGRLRGNWQTTVGHPATGELGIRSEAEALSEMATAEAATPPDGSVFLDNNLPYCEAIEYGHSKQAPAGMMRKNIGRIQQIITRAVREAKK